MTTSIGTKFDPSLSPTQIVGCIRHDIKKAVESKALPKGEYKVELKSYSGTIPKIQITIVNLPFQVIDPNHFFNCPTRDRLAPIEGYLPKARVVIETLLAIHSSYNCMHDQATKNYFVPAYIGEVKIDYGFRSREYDQLLMNHRKTA